MLHDQDFLGVVGPSGAGKTTLLRAILGLIRPDSGRVARRAGLRTGYVPQVGEVDLTFPLTVAECILLARAPHRNVPWTTRHERERVDELLDRLGLDGLAERHLRDLSGGQLQRVFVARALLADPQLLVLDEPTSGIDVSTRHEVLHLLAQLHESGPAIVLATHDLNGLAAHLPRIVCLNHRIVGEGAPVDVLTPTVLETTFGAPFEVLVHAGLPVVVDRRLGVVGHHHQTDGSAMNDFLHPFGFEFFRQAFLVAVLAGALCALIGTFIVVRGMAYLGHGLSHAVFGGFAVSAIVGVNVVVGAAVWGVVVALMIGRVSRRKVVTTDASIGVLTLASFALGLALLQWRPTDTVNPDAALFGDVLGVSRTDLLGVAVVAVVAVALVVGRYRSFVATSFDPDVAAASGINVRRTDAMLLALLAVSVLAAMNVMGATLVAAGVVIPPATARLITHRFSRMLWLSTVFGAAGGAVGMLGVVPPRHRVGTGDRAHREPRLRRGLRVVDGPSASRTAGTGDSGPPLTRCLPENGRTPGRQPGVRCVALWSPETLRRTWIRGRRWAERPSPGCRGGT